MRIHVMRDQLRSIARLVLPGGVRRCIFKGWLLVVSPNRKTIALNAVAEAALILAIHLGPKFSVMRLRSGRPRTLWGVTPILTLPLKARADQALGFEST